MHHLDNAATSWPKPPAVVEAVVQSLTTTPGNPGRGGGVAAREASARLEQARAEVADFLGLARPERLAFTLNATDALNLAVKGLVQPGSRVVSTRLEHSAVLRPLRGLEAAGRLRLRLLDPGPDGRISPDELAREADAASLVVLSCASNVTGVVQPWSAAAKALEPCGVPLLLDAAQAAGGLPIDFDALGPRVALAFTAHKGLGGPMGCGGLLVGEELEIRPWREGGTGDGRSRLQPERMPARLEAGTPPLPAILGLAAAVRWWRDTGVEELRETERSLGRRLHEGLRSIDGVTLPGPTAPAERVPLSTFTVAGYRPDEVAALLDSEFSVSVRAGLHCARDAHELLGTEPEGAVRASVGPTTTEADVAALLDGVAALAAG